MEASNTRRNTSEYQISRPRCSFRIRGLRCRCCCSFCAVHRIQIRIPTEQQQQQPNRRHNKYTSSNANRQLLCLYLRLHSLQLSRCTAPRYTQIISQLFVGQNVRRRPARRLSRWVFAARLSCKWLVARAAKWRMVNIYIGAGSD